MKLKTYFFSWLSVALLAVSCTDELQEASVGKEDSTLDDYFFVIASDGPQTRVAYDDIYHSTFESDDRLGIFAYNPEGSPTGTSNTEYRVINIENVSDNTYRQVLEKVNPSDEMPEGAVAIGYKFVIYYPYDKNMTKERLENLAYSVQTDQASAATSTTLSGYEASDLLWAVETGGEDGADKVTVHFDHVMANIVLEVDENLIDRDDTGSGYEPVYVLNVPVEASDINLTTEITNSDNSHKKELVYTASGNRNSTVRMWDFDYISSGSRVFRAAIPACWTVSAGTSFLQIRQNGKNKTFSLKANLELKPGRNYVFTLTKSKPEQPELSDDDSWVLDVIDPETGEKVGLLCREYLRYQPEDISHHTGTEGTNADNTPTKWINSQAWVFYNLKENSDIPYLPDLNKGTVLRLIYDIDERYTGIPIPGIEQKGIARWPKPHYQKDQHGVFTADHGMYWAGASESSSWDYGGNSIVEGKHEYHMHGGTIYWDGDANKISKFELPAVNITNEQAKQGYISIDRATNEVKVSYDSFDENRSKKALIIPHNLIDKRETASGQLEIQKYPLVKIGYNQFWMSQSLRTKTMTNGTALMPYNATGTPGVTFASDKILTAPGYIYAFETFDDGNVYDPYNSPEQQKPAGGKYEAVLLYNKLAVQSENFTPRSEEVRTIYTMPTEQDMVRLDTYFGPHLAGKLCTREIAPYRGNSFAVSKYEAVLNGQTYGNDGTLANTYVSNISGFNLRAIGAFEPSGHKVTSGSAVLILKTGNTGVDYFSLHIWAPFAQDNDDLLRTNQYSWSQAQTSHYFAQVRFVISFKGQNPVSNNGNSGSTRTTKSVAGLHSSNKENRTVYIRLE